MNFSDPVTLVIASFYFLISGVLTFFSIIAVYVLIRYGRNTLLTLVISLIYIFFFVKLLADSYKTFINL